MGGNFGSRFIDIIARKPSGRLGRLLYQDPKGHYKTFQLVLEMLQLNPEDVYLEVGCGGGVLLEMALRTVQSAKAVDVSPDMIALARERNRTALSQGRAEIVEGNALALSWEDETFTCAGSANMFFYVEQPLKTLAEIRRVLQPRGRLAIVTHPKDPWFLPIAKLFAMRLYSNSEMESMMRDAGFSHVEAKKKGIAYQVCYAVK